MFAGAAALLPADILYNVTVDTTSLLNTSGYIDFQLGPSGNSQSATASILNFSANGPLNQSDIFLAGDANGTLPGVVSIGNSAQFNNYFEAITFGTKVSFQLNFSGDAVNSPNSAQQAGNRFAFGLFAADQSTPLGTNDSFGNLFVIDLNSDGTSVADTSSAVIPASVTPQVAAEAPEPGALGLLGAGLLGWLGLRRIGVRVAKLQHRSRFAPFSRGTW
jgi:hypothetical protein